MKRFLIERMPRPTQEEYERDQEQTERLAKEGKLFRVNSRGEGKLVFDSPETHLRSLAVKRDGTLLVGGSGKGRIYEVRADGAAHALYDSSLNEISSIYVDSNGMGWAAGASNVLPTSAPQKPQQPKPGTQQSTPSATTWGG